MPQDSVTIWKTEYKKLPLESKPGKGPKNLSSFIAERVASKLVINPGTLKIDPVPVFSWQKSLFETPLLALVATADPVTPKVLLTQAWSTSILASTMTITPGSKLNPPPPGTNGIVGTALAIADPPSVALATSSFLAKLIAAEAGSGVDSAFPEACHDAFSKITFTITGTDTTVPTPIPFLLPLTGVQ